MGCLTGFKYTESLHQFLIRYHPDKYALITVFGHNELLADVKDEYLEWVQTNEAEPYLKGGELYEPPH